MLETLRRYRRDLHRTPELGFELPKTIAYVETILAPLGCTLLYPAPSTVCAFFDAGKPETIAFRADMDALPVEEATGAAYASAHAGKMHACGHDGHTSMLLGLASIVQKRLQTLHSNVLLIFQPAEETTGGAKSICESGLLERYGVKYIFGIHIWPELPAGEIWTKPGAVMAKTGIVHVEIKGKSAHVARSEEGADALYAGVEFLHNAYGVAESAPPLHERRLLKFGFMQSGTVENALSAHTDIKGTMRTYDSDLHARMVDALREDAAHIGEKTGCCIRVSVSEGYPPVINDKALYSRVMEHLGENAPMLLEKPSLTGEDFSFYQMRVPGVFFFLGTGREIPLHAATFDFDEAILGSGLRLYERLLDI